MRWRSSHATVKGLIEPATGPDGAAGWRFEIDGVDGQFAADELGARPLPLDKLVVRGIAFPDSGRAEVSQFLMNAGPANVAMAGTIATSGTNRQTRLDGRIGPMPLDALKAMWPQGLAPQTRQWVAGRVVTGQLTGGSFSIVSQRPSVRDVGGATAPVDREIALDLEVEKIGIEYLKGMPLLEAPNARLTINGTAATFFLPSAAIRSAPGQQLQIQDARLLVSGIDQERPLAHVGARLAGPAGAMLDLLGRQPLGLLRNTALDASGFDGKLDARFSAKFPIHDALSMKDVQIIEAKASIVEGQARKVMGRYTISGASIRAEARDNVIDVAGEALLEGVLTRLSWRHALLADPKELQSLKLRAMLGNSERAALGINLGDLVSGDVQLDLTVRPGDDEAPLVRAVADLTAAEINLSRGRLVEASGAARRAAVRPRQAARRQCGAAEFQARRRHHRHQRLGRARRRQPADRVSVHRFLAQYGEQPHRPRLVQAGSGLGNQGERAAVRRPGPVPRLPQCRQGQARKCAIAYGRDRYRGHVSTRYRACRTRPAPRRRIRSCGLSICA